MIISQRGVPFLYQHISNCPTGRTSCELVRSMLIPTSGFDTPMLASIEKYFAYFMPRELAPKFLI